MGRMEIQWAECKHDGKESRLGRKETRTGGNENITGGM